MARPLRNNAKYVGVQLMKDLLCIAKICPLSSSIALWGQTRSVPSYTETSEAAPPLVRGCPHQWSLKKPSVIHHHGLCCQRVGSPPTTAGKRLWTGPLESRQAHHTGHQPHHKCLWTCLWTGPSTTWRAQGISQGHDDSRKFYRPPSQRKHHRT